MNSSFIYVFVPLLQIVAVVIYFQSSTGGHDHQIAFNLIHDNNQRSTGPADTFDVTRKPFNTRLEINLKDETTRQYFHTLSSGALCYSEGTDLSRSSNSCQCRTGYFGRECGIPAAVWYRTVENKYHRWKITPREIPRRIIHGLNINHETEFFQVRLEELKVSTRIEMMDYC